MGHSLLLSGRRLASAKVIAAAVASVLALAAVLVVTGRGPHVPLPSAKTAPRPASLPLAAQGAISDALGRDRSAFHIAAGRGGLVAGNSAMAMSARFGARGAFVRAGGATFGLRLLGYRAVTPRAHANRVTYRHGTITEWYSNGPLGLEQGFDVQRAPAGAAGDLAIRLGLSGNVRARATGSNALTLSGPHGHSLNYTGLSATDARGHTLRSWLTLDGRQAVIHVRTAGAIYPVRVDPFIQVAKLTDPTPTAQGAFGALGLSIQGHTAAISVSAAGMPQPDTVDVFVARGGSWQLGATRVATLTDPNSSTSGFGSSVSLTPDEKTLAVGADSGAGKVFVFQNLASGWTLISTLTNAAGTPADTLGQSVSISADGSTIAAGAPHRPSNQTTTAVGAIDVFEKVGMNWPATESNPKSLTYSAGKTTDQLGVSVAISGNGHTIVGGAWGAFNGDFTGEAQVYDQPASGWAPTASPSATLFAPNEKPGESFGNSVAISTDAKTIAVAARDYALGRGAVFIYTSGGTWIGTPTATATLMTSNGRLEHVGWSVATDGRTVIAGAPFATIGGNNSQGAAYVFSEPSGGWRNTTETQELVANDGGPGDALGWLVALSNGTALTTASSADVAGKQDAGAVYAFGSFPATSISLSPSAPNGSNGWYRTAVRVTVGARDTASTVNGLRCAADLRVAPTSFFTLPAACPFAVGGTIANSGLHAVYAAASNTSGYASNPTSRTIKIDTGKPQVKCVPTPTFILRGRGGLVPATVSDAVSGPAASLIGARANVRKTGRKSVTLIGRDNAGNATTVHCGYQVAAPQVPTSFPFGYTFFRDGTMFTTLKAKKVPKGATLAVTCKGPKCPFKRRTLHPAKKIKVCKGKGKQRRCKTKAAPALQTLNVLPLLKSRHLKPKTKLTLTVTKPNTIGVTETFTMGKIGKRPKVAGPSCLAPGSNKPGKGCRS